MVQSFSVRNPHGILIARNLEGLVVEEADLLSCVHCQYTWSVKPGSGITRGFCARCGGPTCNRPVCKQKGCEPFQRWLDMVERKASRVW